jgi:uncharacterized protein YggE
VADTIEPTSKNKQKISLQFSLNYKIIAIILAVALVATIAMWRPWVRDATNRTISVTGESIVTAETDEYTFSPSWELTAATEQEALTLTTTKSNEVVAELKKLGVAEEDIKVTGNGSSGMYYPESTTTNPTYYLSIQAVVKDKDTAQKVQDYLITTSPTGAVTPYGSFSENKQNELESQARDEATADARAKADQTAKNLGFKVGKVKTVSDLQPGYAIMATDGLMAGSSIEKGSAMAVQTGSNNLNYSVTVEYYIN